MRHTVKDDLIAARALIDTPEKWCKGAFELDGHLCALGALRKATTGSARLPNAAPGEFVRYIRARMWIESKVSSGVEHFNDDPATTHADVLAMFDRAIEAAS